MEIKELLGNLESSKKNIDQALKLVKNIDRYISDLAANLPLVKSNLTKLQKLANECLNADPIFQTILNWTESLDKELSREEESIKDQFGIMLERELIPQGYNLTGNFPKFAAGFFTIEAR